MAIDTLDRFRPRPARERVVYTVPEVADMLGLALNGTYTLIRGGHNPGSQDGRPMGRPPLPRLARRHRGPGRRGR